MTLVLKKERKYRWPESQKYKHLALFLKIDIIKMINYEKKRKMFDKQENRWKNRSDLAGKSVLVIC